MIGPDRSSQGATTRVLGKIALKPIGRSRPSAAMRLRIGEGRGSMRQEIKELRGAGVSCVVPRKDAKIVRARELHGAAILARVPACADRACQELHSRARSPPDAVAGVAYEGEHCARAQWGRREEPRFVHPS